MRKKILWLASWYPNRIDRFNGDFIQRHAQAAGLYYHVTVLFVMRDAHGEITNSVLEEETQTGNVTEHRIYYHTGKAPRAAQQLISLRHYLQLFKKAIRQYIDENGVPHLVHVHVALKAGWLARWIKKRYGIPYVVTEHWTGLLPEAKDYFENGPVYHRLLCRHIWKDASSISAVSAYLHGHLKKLLPSKDVCVIQNVVDTTLFRLQLFQKPISPAVFIHVSGLGYQKNAEAIIQAFALVKAQHIPAQLYIVGPQVPALQRLADTLDVADIIFFRPEVPQPQLAAQMQQADALILYSRYETFGCVVIEANACGLPVIVSNIPAMQELVEEGVNGLFAAGENPAALAEKIVLFINNRKSFNASHIARQAQEQYNYNTIGLLFSNWYEAVLHKPQTPQQ